MVAATGFLPPPPTALKKLGACGAGRVVVLSIAYRVSIDFISEIVTNVIFQHSIIELVMYNLILLARMRQSELIF